jgi:rubrerythrin
LTSSISSDSGEIELQAIEEILLTAIAIERYGQEYYSKFASKISDKTGKALMHGLGNDEKEHEEIISKHYMENIGKAPPKKISIDIGAKAIKEIFSPKKGKSEGEIMLETLQIGIVIEKKSVDFYTASASGTKDVKLKQVLNALIDIEKGHKAMLEENLFHLRQDGTWWGYVPILDG